MAMDYLETFSHHVNHFYIEIVFKAKHIVINSG